MVVEIGQGVIKACRPGEELIDDGGAFLEDLKMKRLEAAADPDGVEQPDLQIRGGGDLRESYGEVDRARIQLRDRERADVRV